MEQEDSIDIKEFLGVIRKRIRLIIIITLIIVLSCGFYLYFLADPVYEAKASFVLGNLNDKSSQQMQNNDSVMMYQNLLKTYDDIAQSRTVAKNALVNLNSNMNVDSFMKSIKVTSETGTQVVSIAVDSSNAQDALNKCNAVSDAFTTQANKLLPNGSVQVMDGAAYPKTPIKPRKTLDIAISFFIGLILSVGLAFLLEYMDHTIKTEKDVEKYLGISVIGTIPDYTNE